MIKLKFTLFKHRMNLMENHDKHIFAAVVVVLVPISLAQFRVHWKCVWFNDSSHISCQLLDIQGYSLNFIINK